MTEKLRPPMSRAQFRCGNVLHTLLTRLPYQHRSQIEPPFFTGLGWISTRRQHFRSNLITPTTNTYSTMNYHIFHITAVCPQEGYSLGQNPRRRSSPPGVDQCHGMTDRVDQIHRDAVGCRNRQEDSRGLGGVAVSGILDVHAADRLVPKQVRSMHLLG